MSINNVDAFFLFPLPLYTIFFSTPPPRRITPFSGSVAEWDDYLRLGTAKRQPHHLTLLEELHCQMYIREVRGLRFEGTEDGKCFRCGFFAPGLRSNDAGYTAGCSAVVLC